MHNTEKTCLKVKHSNLRATSAHETGVQIIHQIIIPEKPVGLIGEKVKYSDKYLKWHEKRGTEVCTPVPESGYFTITKAELEDDGRVMVALQPWPSNYGRFMNGTHICLGNMVKYQPEK
jgi:hypothetical protein